MSSVFDNLMSDLLLMEREFLASPSTSLEQDSARHAEFSNIQTGIMNTDPMNACRCFIVFFIGKDGGDVTLEDTNDLQGMMSRVGGALKTEVDKFLAELGVAPTEQGGGAMGWHVGVHCSPGEAWIMAVSANTRFAKAVKHGLLDIHVRPWSIKPYYQGE